MFPSIPSKVVLPAALAAILTAPQPTLQRLEAVEPHMGTLVQITVYTATQDEARGAFRAAFDRIRALDRTLSDYRPESELSRVTSREVGHPVRVSDDLFAVLRAAQALARETDGAFDVTQGPITRLWREARKSGRVPDGESLKKAGERSGYQKLHLDERHQTVTVDVAGMALDAGAIGKGYAASEALAVLTRRGVDRALVAVSGDLAFSEAPPAQRGWRIRIHDTVLELTNAAVSTSGSVEQHLDAEGRRYSHVIDPATGLGLVNDITVTVVAPHGLEADGLDTAASVLGPGRGLALIESHPAAAGLIVQRTDAGTQTTASRRFKVLAGRGL